jgi:hypothetical protein
MITVLGLGRTQQARVWLEECPVSGLTFDGLVRRTFEVSGSVGSDRRVTIEAKLPRGPMVMYGLLGAHFSPKDDGGLAVAVGCTETTDRPLFASSLATKPEVARTGLPREFADGVLAGVQDALASTNLGSGVLMFDCAASGEVGSSSAAYRLLARAVVTILATGASDEMAIRAALHDIF